MACILLDVANRIWYSLFLLSLKNYLWIFPYFREHFIADMTIQVESKWFTRWRYKSNHLWCCILLDGKN